MKLFSLSDIGRSLNQSRQQVWRDYVKKGFLVQTEDKQIDIENPANWQFLKSKGADITVFYPPKGQETRKKKIGRPKKDNKKDKEPTKTVKQTILKDEKQAPIKQKELEKDIESVVFIAEKPAIGEKPRKPQKDITAESTIVELEQATRFEKYNGLLKDNEIKELKLQEERTRLIDKDVVKHIVFDTIGVISQEVQGIPYAIVDELISICLSTPDTARELITSMLLSKYAIGVKKATEEAEKIFRKRKF